MSNTIKARTPTREVTEVEKINDDGASILLITFTANRNVDNKAHAHAEKYPLPYTSEWLRPFDYNLNTANMLWHVLTRMEKGESARKVRIAVVIPQPRKKRKE